MSDDSLFLALQMSVNMSMNACMVQEARTHQRHCHGLTGPITQIKWIASLSWLWLYIFYICIIVLVSSFRHPFHSLSRCYVMFRELFCDVIC